MTIFTAQSILAAILVVNDRSLCVPLLARNRGINDQLGLPPEVLPVVSVDTRGSFVGFIALRIGTPDGLVVKHIEISVFLKFLNQINRDLGLCVRE